MSTPSTEQLVEAGRETRDSPLAADADPCRSVGAEPLCVADAQGKSDPVSRIVWDWRAPQADAPSPSRGRGVLVRFAIGLLVATALALRFPRLATVAAALTVLLAVVGLVAPAVGHRIDALLAKFGRAVGALLTGFLLGLLFVLWFVPGRLLLLLRRRDPLHLRFPAADATFWVTYRPAPDRRHYERQSR